MKGIVFVKNLTLEVSPYPSLALRQAQGHFDTQNEYIKAEGHEQAKRGTHICGMPLSVSNGSPGRTRIPLKAGLTATRSTK